MITKKLLSTITSIVFSLISTDAFAQEYCFNEVDYTPKETTFRLFAPSTAKKVCLKIYRDDYTNPMDVGRTKKMKLAGKDLWELTVKGDLKGKYYTFSVFQHRRYSRGCLFSPSNKYFSYGETPGIFAKAVGVNGKRGVVVDMNETDPQGWKNDRRPALKSPSDLIIYELHHRDFSIDASSGLVNKGKFLALTEPKAIDYLKELGVNAIHILPSFDYASVDETRLNTPQYNWGYDPLNYNVLEGSYSTDPYNPVTRIKEFKQMVQALHQAGIRVVLDVVYNHTFNIEGSAFQRTYPDYFYRKLPNGKYSNGSGCGNETASERAMMRRFMIESVKYWIDEYHIDGFRFDLMGVHDIETMNDIRAEVDKIDPSIFIYGEGWSAGSCAYPADKLALKVNLPQMSGIAAFSDDIRDALRGPFNDDRKGAFLAGISGSEESLKAGIVGMTAHPQVDYGKVNYSKKAWAMQPTQMISYVSCHDDMCLVDRLKASIPDITTDELIRLDLLAQTAVFTSQGVPFILCGEEMLRNKKGVHNSYNSPDSINRLDWNNLKKYPKVFEYYKGLISLRKGHKAFRMADTEDVSNHLKFICSQPCLLGFSLNGHAVGDVWNTIIVILNSNREAKVVDIPQGKYTVVCCDGVIDENGLGETAGGKVVVDPQSALILHD